MCEPARPAELDRLGYVGRTVAGYGLRVGLQASEPEALEVLVRGLPGRWRRSADGAAARTYSLVVDRRDGCRYALYANDRELVRSGEPERVLEFLVGSVGFYVAQHATRLTFVHSGAVGWQGHAILLPGRENSGKTTLTGALVRAGATYLSDDYSPIDDRGRVHPFPRPLSVRRDNGLPSRLIPVGAFGGVQEARALPVGLVVFAPYTGVRRWRPRRVAPGKGVLDMLAHTVSAQTRPKHALERLGRVVTQSPVLNGGRGEAEETARLILRRLEQAVAAGS